MCCASLYRHFEAKPLKAEAPRLLQAVLEGCFCAAHLCVVHNHAGSVACLGLQTSRSHMMISITNVIVIDI